MGDENSANQPAQNFGQIGNDFASTDIMGSDMENISWSTLFQGIKVNTGVRFIVVFLTFVSWLYVVYWVRHHEPFVNQAMGVSAPHSATTAADRSIIARVINVFPFHSSGIKSSAFYSPSPVERVQPKPSYFSVDTYNKSFGQGRPKKAYTGWALNPGPTMAPPLIGPAEQKFDQRFGSPVLP
jgi:hypothetical protein